VMLRSVGANTTLSPKVLATAERSSSAVEVTPSM
jgi:hypothetical protein